MTGTPFPRETDAIAGSPEWREAAVRLNVPTSEREPEGLSRNQQCARRESHAGAAARPGLSLGMCVQWATRAERADVLRQMIEGQRTVDRRGCARATKRLGPRSAWRRRNLHRQNRKWLLPARRRTSPHPSRRGRLRLAQAQSRHARILRVGQRRSRVGFRRLRRGGSGFRRHGLLRQSGRHSSHNRILRGRTGRRAGRGNRARILLRSGRPRLGKQRDEKDCKATHQRPGLLRTGERELCWLDLTQPSSFHWRVDH